MIRKALACAAAAVCPVLTACATGEPPATQGPALQPETAASTAIAPSPGPSGLPRLDVEPAFPDISLGRMVHLAYSSESDDRLFAALQPGRIVFFENRRDAARVQTFMDIRGRVSDRGNEEGLLGLAFDPAYESNGYFYVYYSAADPRRSVISRFSVDPGDPARADASSERQIMVVPQPYSNHNGGHIVFGPDGYLYVGLGDGGSANDPRGNGRTGPPCSGAFCASTSRPSIRRAATPSRPTTHSSERAAGSDPRYGPTGSGTPGGSTSTARPATCGRRTSARTPGRRSTSSGRGSTTAGT